ncbi:MULTISPECIES: hypothetical protein [unclassified Amycolatopsis]|uniref:hypothetical protein n=1 Tax=unclassified Amycolatopsis TaxID=2618356 RepID=UPI001FF3B95C|nr:MULTISPECIES: hypothetical protein [unclassified Amycolatopsis]UOZ07218.1 hypothetical protein MUY22_02680 [Amycolatopsis sp. WQ 127309]WSJ73466.1 hypothetical protein OG439_28810 [Amycolatopsis sp. NBC_01307]WSK82880.1 hypothetical protein OG570_20860 [Amycolatopsis sp. NBC_01286]
MGTLIGVVAAVIIGGGLATGAGFALIQSADPDSTAQVQDQLNAQVKYNPADHPAKLYGNR